MTDSGSVLFFDSGVGGLTVVREARILLKQHQFIYVADNAAFPYGAWEEQQLRDHLINLFGKLLAHYKPALSVIACNTASTLVLDDLRQHYPDHQFVGTVPAIKPAAEQTASQQITVLATPGTVRRAYTRQLIDKFATQCDVTLVGSDKLAGWAENYLRGHIIDLDGLREEIAPCFKDKNGARTDIVVMACTHYPFLVNLMRKAAPWPVDWIDPAEAIARRAHSLLPESVSHRGATNIDRACFTGKEMDIETRQLLYGFGFQHFDDYRQIG